MKERDIENRINELEEENQLLRNEVRSWKEASEINAKYARQQYSEVAEAAVRLYEREEQLRSLMGSARDAIIGTDDSGRVMLWNSAASRMFGISKKEASDKYIYDLVIDESEKEALVEALTPNGQEIAEPQTGNTFDILAKNIEGKTFPAEVSISFQQHDNTWQTLCIIRDITLRKEAESVLKRSAQQLEELVKQRTADLKNINDALFDEIEHRKEVQSRLEYSANYDFLTGLPNRHLFYDRLQQAMLRISRSKAKKQRMALMLLDLDNFKVINDSYGHDTGDMLLKAIARRFNALGRAHDTIARLGGDEFIIIFDEAGTLDDIHQVAKRILKTFSKPFNLNNNDIFISFSVGVAIFPDHQGEPEDMVRYADLAMYHAKKLGRNNYQLYDAGMNDDAIAHITLRNELHHALERNEFVLYYQPQIDANSGHVVGAEALLRWQHPIRGIVPPDAYISLLEDTGLIVPVGNWVIKEACRQLQRWQTLGLPPVTLSINASPRQFRRQENIAQTVDEILKETGAPANRLEIEITESLFLEDESISGNALRALQEMGISIALDDFGTGYSSLSYLKRFQLNTLKIDRIFVKDIHTNLIDKDLVKGIIALAQTLSMTVVAEGVEEQEQSDILCEMGCDKLQGYLYSRPVPLADFEKMLGNGRKRTKKKIPHPPA